MHTTYTLLAALISAFSAGWARMTETAEAAEQREMNEFFSDCTSVHDVEAHERAWDNRHSNRKSYYPFV